MKTEDKGKGIFDRITLIWQPPGGIRGEKEFK